MLPTLKSSTFDVLVEPAKRQLLIQEIRGMDYLNPSIKSYRSSKLWAVCVFAILWTRHAVFDAAFIPKALT